MPFYNKFRIYPYGPSDTANLLNEALNGLLIKQNNSQYKYRPDHLVINWGSSKRPVSMYRNPCLNVFELVDVATSKMGTFQTLKNAGVQTVPWTKDKKEALHWLKNGKVLGRDLDKGSQGRGITVYQKKDKDRLGDHLFYVPYIKKEREIRVHVFGDKPIFVQEKLKKNGHEDRDPYIRSHLRGWIFGFHHLEEKPVDPIVIETAVKAVRAIGLDFGAVDIGWSKDKGATVFEINTAPGLEETSLKKYVEAFQGVER
jgi:glutathione synthase/RimK-type ligase-like ATP-grasp enzyme